MAPQERLHSPQEIYDQLFDILNSPSGIDYSELKNILTAQPDRTLLLKMLEKISEARLISFEKYPEFYDFILHQEDIPFIQFLLHQADLEFDTGGYLFVFYLLSSRNSDIFRMTTTALKSRRLCGEPLEKLGVFLMENLDHRKLIDFCSTEYTKEFKTIWYQLVQGNQIALDLRMRLLEQLKGLGDTGFSKILEKIAKDPEPVIATTAQRLLTDIFGKYSLVREDRDTQTRQQTPQEHTSRNILERSSQGLMILGGAFFLFLILHLFLGNVIPGVVTYFCYLGFIAYVSLLGPEEGMSGTVLFTVFAPVFYAVNFTPNFAPSWIVWLTFALFGVVVTQANRRYFDHIEDLQRMRNADKSLRNRITTLESQLNNNLDAIQSLKEKLTERTVKLYSLMINLRDIISTRDLDKIGHAIRDILHSGLGASSGQIYLFDRDKNEFFTTTNFIYTDKKFHESTEKRIRPDEDPLIPYIMQHKEIITADDFRKKPELLSIAKKTRIATKLIAPLVVDREVLALINIEKCEKESFAEDDITLLSSLVTAATTGLQNASVFNLNREELERTKKLGDFERKRQEQLKEMFGKYVSPQVVEQMLENPDKVSLGGVSREIAILILDIRGFTSFSEHTQPEIVVDLLNSFFKVTSTVILDCQGTIDKFMGDAVLCLFGAPVIMENPCQKAVECAFKIRNECQILKKEFISKYNFDLNIGQAINFGKVIVGNIGSEKRMEYTAIGDTVNTVARLEEISLGGQILVTESVYSLVSYAIDGEKIGDYQFKGKQTKAGVYNLLKWKGNI